MKVLRNSAFLLLLAGGCLPQNQAPAAAPSNEVKVNSPADGDIPWATGDKPVDGAATTRSTPDPEPVVEEVLADRGVDGVKQTQVVHACSGKATPALRAAIQVRAQEVGQCAEKIPAESAEAQGEISIAVRVEKNGMVSTLEVLKDTLAIEKVMQCAQSVLKQTFTEKPRGGCAIFVVPFILTSQQAPQDQGE